MSNDQDTMPRMKCEHPLGCWRDDDDGARCLWCQEVRALKGQSAAITEQIEAKAIVMKDGSLTIEGDLGYLAIHGGAVAIESMTCTNCRSDAAYSVPSKASEGTGLCGLSGVRGEKEGVPLRRTSREPYRRASSTRPGR